MSLLNYFTKSASAQSRDVEEPSEQENDSSDSSEITDSSRPKMKKRKKSLTRKYDSSYLKYGFICTNHDKPLPLCVVCSKTLANESMKPTNLIRHLKKCHIELIDKPLEYFERLKSNMKEQKKTNRCILTICACCNSFVVQNRTSNRQVQKTIQHRGVSHQTMFSCCCG